MTTTTLPATLSFHQTELRIIDRDGNPWITAADLAKALGYSRSDKVSSLYERNADEFTEDMTLTLKLGVKGFGNGNSKKDTRIFSTRGCHLVAMLARTPAAKEFRRWVLDVLDKLNQQNQAPQRAVTYPESFHSLNFRALVTVEDGQHVRTRGLEPGEMIMHPDHIAGMIPDGACFTSEQVASILTACARRLAAIR